MVAPLDAASQAGAQGGAEPGALALAPLAPVLPDVQRAFPRARHGGAHARPLAPAHARRAAVQPLRPLALLGARRQGGAHLGIGALAVTPAAPVAVPPIPASWRTRALRGAVGQSHALADADRAGGVGARDRLAPGAAHATLCKKTRNLNTLSRCMEWRHVSFCLGN